MMPLENIKTNSKVNIPSIRKTATNEKEIDVVSKKVEKTKQEIQHLKLELEKLINIGLGTKTTNNNFSQAAQTSEYMSQEKYKDKFNKEEIYNEKQSTCSKLDGKVFQNNDNISPENSKNVNISLKYDVLSNVTTRINFPTLRKYSANNETNKYSCKKKSEYDKQIAREYIKKQREKRAELIRDKIKETQNTIDARKQKLKELHERSLKLVSKNIKHKQIQSHEKIVEMQPSIPLKTIFQEICTVPSLHAELDHCDVKVPHKNAQVNSDKLEKLSLFSKFGNKNISSEAVNTIPEMNYENIILHNAATKIQACFKGYRQRKLLKKNIDNQTRMISKIECFVQVDETNLPKSKISWFETPASLPYPYNFINAVKRKLNYAVHNKEKIEEKTYSDPIYLKSTSNEKCGDKVIPGTNCLKRNLQNKDILSPVEISHYNKSLECQKGETKDPLKINKISEVNISEKPLEKSNKEHASYFSSRELVNSDGKSNLNVFHLCNCLDLNLKTIQPLSLKVSQLYATDNIKIKNYDNKSDSDTSKNIPEISTESSVNTNDGKKSHFLNSKPETDYNLAYGFYLCEKQKLAKKNNTIDTLLSNNNCEIEKKNLAYSKEVHYSSLHCDREKNGTFKNLPASTVNNIVIMSDTASDTNESLLNSKGTATKMSAEPATEKERENNLMLHSSISNVQNLGTEIYSNPKFSQTNSENNLSEISNNKSPHELISSENKLNDKSVSQNKFLLSGEDKNKYSSDFSSLSIEELDYVPSLKRPSIALNTSHVSLHKTNKLVTLASNSNLLIPSEQKQSLETKLNSNEIHLKFEAEIRLLHHFNKSLQEAVEKEKSLLENHYIPKANKEIKDSDSPLNCSTIDQRKTNSFNASKTNNQARIMTINYSRGSEVLDESLENLTGISDNNESIISTDLRISSLKDTFDSNQDSGDNVSLSLMKNENEGQVYTGLSLGVFDQLIKDEDVRIENLKTILKIREKSLLDRTKSELAWLEIQKRQLRDSGQLNEISIIKKKQRGLLVKLQHERHEMQRLKQLQKAASKERKTLLRQQRNMIKAQLSTNKTFSKLKSSSRGAKHHSGPLKVLDVYSCSESVLSETSIVPKKSSTISEGIISIVSRSHSINSTHLTDVFLNEISNIDNAPASGFDGKSELGPKHNENLRRSLLMRESALNKRRKIAEELLQWHQRLVKEERQITELESAADSIINQVPNISSLKKTTNTKFTFKGCQLNVMWQNITGKKDEKFNDDKFYFMSKEALEQFCKDAKGHIYNTDKNDGNTYRKKVDTCNDVQGGMENNFAELSNTDVREAGNSDNDKSFKSYSSDKESFSTKDIITIPDKPESSEISSDKNYTDDLEQCLTNKSKTSSSLITNLEEKVTTNSKSDLKHPKIVDNYFVNNIFTVTHKNSFPVLPVENNLLNLDKNTMIKGAYDALRNNGESRMVRDGCTFKNVEIDTRNAEIFDATIEHKDNLHKKSSSLTITSQHKIINESNGHSLSILRQCNESILCKSGSESQDCNISSCEIVSEVGVNSLKYEFEDEVELLENSEDRNKSVNSISHIVPDVIDKAPSCESEDKTEIISTLQERQLSEKLKIIKNSEMPDILHKVSECDSFSKHMPQLNRINLSVLENRLNSEYLQESKIHNGNFVDDSPTDLQLISSNNDSDKSKRNLCASKIDFSLDDGNNVRIPENTSFVDDEFSSSKNIEELPDLSSNTDLNDSQIDFQEKYEHVGTNTPENNSYSGQKLKNNSLSVQNEIHFEYNKQYIENQDSTLDYSQVNKEKTIEEITNERNVENISNAFDATVSVSDNEYNSFSKNSCKDSESIEYTNGFCEKTTCSTQNSDIGSENSIHLIDHENPTMHINGNKGSESPVGSELENSKQDNYNAFMENSEKKNDDYSEVRKRIFEILAETNSSKNAKSPRLQDIYTTTYDVLSPVTSPEPVFPHCGELLSKHTYTNAEEEELLKKQLAIEKEIKQIEQQQKEHLPYLILREIPNKPPPPYIPPAPTHVIPSILPVSAEQVNLIVHHFSSFVFNAHVNKSLPSISLLPEIKKQLQSQVESSCQKFIFDLCKQLTIEHYKQFEEQSGPSWLQIKKRPKLTFEKPLDERGLEKFLMRKVKELLGYEKVERKESMIIKWTRKKRDYVDELLVLESQVEETEWTNYDKDELIVINELTNDIINSLIDETTKVIRDILTKRAKTK